MSGLVVSYTRLEMRLSGIYAIVNRMNGRAYIGQTRRPFWARRTQHCVTLKRGNHYNKDLQRDWNTYGPCWFEFRIIAFINKHEAHTDDRDYYERQAMLFWGKNTYNEIPVHFRNFQVATED